VDASRRAGDPSGADGRAGGPHAGVRDAPAARPRRRGRHGRRGRPTRGGGRSDDRPDGCLRTAGRHVRLAAAVVGWSRRRSECVGDAGVGPELRRDARRCRRPRGRPGDHRSCLDGPAAPCRRRRRRRLGDRLAAGPRCRRRADRCSGRRRAVRQRRCHLVAARGRRRDRRRRRRGAHDRNSPPRRSRGRGGGPIVARVRIAACRTRRVAERPRRLADVHGARPDGGDGGRCQRRRGVPRPRRARRDVVAVRARRAGRRCRRGGRRRPRRAVGRRPGMGAGHARRVRTGLRRPRRRRCRAVVLGLPRRHGPRRCRGRRRQRQQRRPRRHAHARRAAWHRRRRTERHGSRRLGRRARPRWAGWGVAEPAGGVRPRRSRRDGRRDRLRMAEPRGDGVTRWRSPRGRSCCSPCTRGRGRRRARRRPRGRGSG
jgi:hypothetical protein